MAAGMSDIRKALADRLNTFGDFQAYEYIPDAVNAPGGFIEPDRPFVNYQHVFQSGQVKWNFVLTILVNRSEERDAQKELDEYLDPEGAFVTLLQSDEDGDELDDICSYVTVTAGTRYGAYAMGGTTYLGAQLEFVVSA